MDQRVLNRSTPHATESPVCGLNSVSARNKVPDHGIVIGECNAEHQRWQTFLGEVLGARAIS